MNENKNYYCFAYYLDIIDTKLHRLELLADNPYQNSLISFAASIVQTLREQLIFIEVDSFLSSLENMPPDNSGDISRRCDNINFQCKFYPISNLTFQFIKNRIVNNCPNLPQPSIKDPTED